MGNVKTVPIQVSSSTTFYYNNSNPSCSNRSTENTTTINVQDGCGFGDIVVMNGKSYRYSNRNNQWVEFSGKQLTPNLAGLVLNVANSDEKPEDLTSEDIKKYAKANNVKANNNVVQLVNRQGLYGPNNDANPLDFVYDAYENNSYKYGIIFSQKEPVEIAKVISEQISNVSNNKKTCDMVKAIPASKLIDVFNEYKKNNKNGLIEDMSREFGMTKDEIKTTLKSLLNYDNDSRLLDENDKQQYAQLSEKAFSGFFDSPKPWEYKNFKALDNFLCNLNKDNFFAPNDNQ